MSPADAVALLATLTLLALLAALVVIYNGLVNLRNDCERAWSNVEVLLKQRYEELPNLVSVCREGMKHENETLARVTDARSAGIRARGPAESSLLEARTTGAVDRLLALAENYPALVASEGFLRLQARITGLESEIADRREYFNDCVNNYNTRIEQLPDIILARMLGYRRKPLFRIPPAERKPPPARAA